MQTRVQNGSGKAKIKHSTMHDVVASSSAHLLHPFVESSWADALLMQDGADPQVRPTNILTSTTVRECSFATKKSTTANAGPAISVTSPMPATSCQCSWLTPLRDRLQVAERMAGGVQAEKDYAQVLESMQRR